MITKTNKTMICALLIAACSFSSCKKEEPVTTLPNDSHAVKVEAFKKITQRQLVTNTAIVKLTLALPKLIAKTSAFMKTDGGIEDGYGFGCGTITIDSSSTPRIAIVDFGSGCTDPVSGKYYAGSFTLQYEDPNLGTAGNHIHVAFSNVVLDSLELDGTLDFVNNGDVNGEMVGDIDYNLQTGFTHDRLRLNGSTHMSFRLAEPLATLFLNISGTGTDSNGVSFTQSTSTDVELKDEDNCREHFVKGVLLITSPGMDDEEINYGNGSCDNLATSTINGVRTTFTLD